MSGASRPSTGKQFGILVLNLGIAAWCAYDLFIAPEPGSSTTRALNYVFLFVTLFVAFGAVLTLTKKTAP